MIESLNSIEIQILRSLAKAPQWRLQRKEILNFINDSRGSDKEVFDQTLQRGLIKLMQMRIVQKSDKGHQRVFYRVPINKQPDIAAFLDKLDLKDTFAGRIDTATQIEIEDLKRQLDQKTLEFDFFVDFINHKFAESITVQLAKFEEKLAKTIELSIKVEKIIAGNKGIIDHLPSAEREIYQRSKVEMTAILKEYQETTANFEALLKELKQPVEKWP